MVKTFLRCHHVGFKGTTQKYTILWLLMEPKKHSDQVALGRCSLTTIGQDSTWTRAHGAAGMGLVTDAALSQMTWVGPGHIRG